jgi:hypothetical protein
MLGNTLRLWGTYWKLEGNIMGTRKNGKKKSFNTFPPPSPPNLKGIRFVTSFVTT